MYRISEIFYSLQGEGARIGTANIFIRFAGCNLTCGFCDTDFESEISSGPLSSRQLIELVKNRYPAAKNIILTGGEPLLQVDQALVNELHQAGYYLALETNGSQRPPEFIDYIACSPKVAEHVVAKNFPDGVDELRYVRHLGQGIPKPKTKARHYYVSPQNNGDQIDQQNFSHCMQLCLDNPDWGLSLQQHKLWKVL